MSAEDQTLELTVVEDILKRFADRDNWRKCTLDDGDVSYDAMAWSPLDRPVDPNTGYIDDPQFHEPDDVARETLVALGKLRSKLTAKDQRIAELESAEERVKVLEAALRAADRLIFAHHAADVAEYGSRPGARE